MLRVRDSMTREVVTLGPEASAAEAWGVCQELGIRHLPIVEGGRLAGVGAHSYSEGDATGGSEEAERFRR